MHLYHAHITSFRDGCFIGHVDLHVKIHSGNDKLNLNNTRVKFRWTLMKTTHEFS